MNNNNNNDNNQVELFDENSWCDLIDYGNLLNDDVAPSPDLFWNNPQNVGDVSLTGAASQIREYGRKRGRGGDQCSNVGTKACREKLRREKLNDRFTELSAILEPGRPVKTDKLAILGDTIRVLNQLKTESAECRDLNEILLEEIKALKAEKNELREEKLMLKADKEQLEHQLKTMTVPQPSGFMPTHPPIYQGGANKMPMFPSYGFVPMWQYVPPSAHDTSQDHKLRPPAA